MPFPLSCPPTQVLLPKIQEAPEGSDEGMIEMAELAPRGNIVFATGIGCLLSVPVFNELTGLPPYLGMLGGLGVIWLLTDVIHAGEKVSPK